MYYYLLLGACDQISRDFKFRYYFKVKAIKLSK